MNSFNSGRTVTTFEIRKLEDIQEFPFTFNVIVRPGFDEAKLQEIGYLNVEEYFVGRSRLNYSVVGWAGHGKNVTGEIGLTGAEMTYNAT